MTEQTQSLLIQSYFRARWPWLLLFLPLCGLTGMGVGFAFAFAPDLGLILGVLVGSLPLWLSRVFRQASPSVTAEFILLALLILVGFGVSFQALDSILSDENIRVAAVIALLLLTPPLYIAYTLINARNIRSREESADHLATLFLGPPIVLSLAMGTTISTYVLLLVHYLQLRNTDWVWVAEKFLDRGIIPPLTLILFFWATLILINKAWTLRKEKALLRSQDRLSLLVQAHGSATSAGDSEVEADSHKLDDNFFHTLWKKSADSYAILRYINWAIPILGFIGTVLGISLAAAGIQKIISNQQVSEFSSDLGQAIAPLGIAFDTTLIALSLSVLLMLLQTLLQRWEEAILIDYENSVRRGS